MLLVASASTTSRSSPAFGTRRERVSGVGDRIICAGRHNPQLDGQIRSAAAIDCGDSSSFDSARIDEIVLSTVTTLLRFTFAATVDDDHAGRAGLVLELDGVVVESGLLVVKADIAVLVKLARRLRGWPYTRRARRCGASAARICAADIDSGGDALTDASGVNSDCRRPLTTRDRSRRD